MISTQGVGTLFSQRLSLWKHISIDCVCFFCPSMLQKISRNKWLLVSDDWEAQQVPAAKNGFLCLALMKVAVFSSALTIPLVSYAHVGFIQWIKQQSKALLWPRRAAVRHGGRSDATCVTKDKRTNKMSMNDYDDFFGPFSGSKKKARKAKRTCWFCRSMIIHKQSVLSLNYWSTFGQQQ